MFSEKKGGGLSERLFGGIVREDLRKRTQEIVDAAERWIQAAEKLAAAIESSTEKPIGDGAAKDLARQTKSLVVALTKHREFMQKHI